MAEAKITASSVNHGKTYDHYYSGDDKSIYHQLYHDKIIPNDERIIREQVENLIKTKPNSTISSKEITILDYGCGDGRFFNFYKELAKEIATKKPDFQLTIIGYDPSLEGLKHFAQRLHTNDFSKATQEIFKDDLSEQKPGNLAYTVGSYIKDNMNVKLIHGHVNDDLSHIEAQIGSADLTLLMFCVLAHVVGQEARIELLTMLDKISTSIFYSVPGPAILPEYQYAFDVLRDKNVSADVMDLVKEDGDILYTRNEQGGAKVQNYLHIYKSTQEVREELEKATVADYTIGINKIFHETHLINHPWLAQIDMYSSKMVSALVPETLLDISLSLSKHVNTVYEYITGDHHLYGAYYMVLQEDDLSGF